jgi:hypothetical protein
MKLNEVGEVTATRTLHRVDRPEDTVTVSIGKPQKFPDSDDYFCSYEIAGAGERRLSYAGGVDGIQALLLAVRKLAVDLEAMDKRTGRALRWNDHEGGDLGFG